MRPFGPISFHEFCRVSQSGVSATASRKTNKDETIPKDVSKKSPPPKKMYMGGSKNRGNPPKWMVYNGNPY